MTTIAVNTPSPAAQGMHDDWQLIADILGGTKAMRAAKTRYMPKRPLEESADYENRLAAATLFPALAETIKRLVGRVFMEPVQPGDDVPGWIKDEVLPDVDLQGRNLHVFARELFDEALGYGLSHVLVESPRADGVRTREDQRNAGVRPYLIRISPRRILGWRATDGVLTQVRIAFERSEDDGEFGTKTIEQVRVYEPGLVRVYEPASEKGAWSEIEAIETGLNRVPLVTYYTGRTGLLTAKPPLLELAHLNCKHWRMQSGIDALIDTACVPILAISGVNDGDKVVIGAKHAVNLPTGAEMKYVEHTGSAIKAGRDALADLVDEMRQTGAKLLQKPQQGKTDAEAREDSADNNSDLGSMAMQLQDTLVDVLDLVAEYRGEAKGGTVTVHPNLDPEIDAPGTFDALVTLYREGALSRPTLFTASKRLGIVPDEVEWDDEQVRIEEEAPPLPKVPPVAPPATGAAA